MILSFDCRPFFVPDAYEFETIGFDMISKHKRDRWFVNRIREQVHPKYCAQHNIIIRKKFKDHFGVEPASCVSLWILLQKSGYLFWVRNPHMEHLLWALLFLNEYSDEASHADSVGCDVKAFQKWAWFYLKGIAGLAKYLVSTLGSFC